MLFLFISELDASDVEPSYSAIDPMELAFHGIDALLFLFIFSYTHHFFFSLSHFYFPFSYILQDIPLSRR